VGQEVLYSGVLYTARDQAHRRLADVLERGKKPPIDLKDAIIYYTGPTPSWKKNMVGSVGPTTSSRMDAFTPILLKAGVGALIGKGNRSGDVVREIKRRGAVYFLAIGGAGAYLHKTIRSAEVVAYKEMGAEAIHKLVVERFPLIVGVDARGNDIYAGK